MISETYSVFTHSIKIDDTWYTANWFIHYFIMYDCPRRHVCPATCKIISRRFAWNQFANVRLLIEDSMCSWSLQMDDPARNLSLRDDGRHHKSSGFLDHRDGERAMHWTCHMVWRTGCPGVCAFRLSVWIRLVGGNVRVLLRQDRVCHQQGEQSLSIDYFEGSKTPGSLPHRQEHPLASGTSGRVFFGVNPARNRSDDGVSNDWPWRNISNCRPHITGEPPQTSGECHQDDVVDIRFIHRHVVPNLSVARSVQHRHECHLLRWLLLRVDDLDAAQHLHEPVHLRVEPRGRQETTHSSLLLQEAYRSKTSNTSLCLVCSGTQVLC